MFFLRKIFNCGLSLPILEPVDIKFFSLLQAFLLDRIMNLLSTGSYMFIVNESTHLRIRIIYDL